MIALVVVTIVAYTTVINTHFIIIIVIKFNHYVSIAIIRALNFFILNY